MNYPSNVTTAGHGTANQARNQMRCRKTPRKAQQQCVRGSKSFLKFQYPLAMGNKRDPRVSLPLKAQRQLGLKPAL